MNIEISQIEEKKKYYVVTEDEDVKIPISKELVEKIVSKVPDVNNEEVIIILATIESSKIFVNASHKRVRKIENEDLERGVIELLQEYTAENLAEIFENLKYHEIQEVFETGNSFEVLQNMI